MRTHLFLSVLPLLAWGCHSGTEPRRSDVATLTISPAETQTTGIGGMLQLAVTVTDTAGGTVRRPVVRWASSDSRRVSISSDTGSSVVLTALAPTTAAGVRIVASSGGREARVTVVVADVPAPRVTAISAEVLAPGMSDVTITGTGFGAAAGMNAVMIDGVAASVTSAAPTRLTVSIPIGGFDCLPRRDVWIQVTAGGLMSGGKHPFAAATPLSQQVGETVILTPGSQPVCVELASSGAESYLVGIVNSNSDAPDDLRLRLEGEASSLMASPSGAPRVAGAGDARPFRPLAIAPSLAITRARGSLHERLLAVDRELVRRRRALAPAPAARARVAGRVDRGALRGGVSRALAPALNDTVSFHVRDINTDVDCTQGFRVSARAVYVGRRAIVFEDVDAPLAGTMDAFFQRIGEEFDGTTYPMLVNNFGDPLAYDDQLAGHGKVLMLFTPVLNTRFQNVAGFVSACDFFPYDTTTGPFQDLVSNEGAIFYSFVPTTTAEQGQREAFIRGVLAHESKHLASYAARFVNNAQALEEGWLEEATAQIASEIYQRSYSHSIWKRQAPYETSVGCEPPLSQVNDCTGDHPQVMLHHFSYLYDYLSSMDPRSPLDRTSAAYYGGAWSFVRWAVDQYAGSESALLTALTQTTTQLGVANISARTGVPFDDMIVRWSLASALARYPGLPISDARLTIPSWDQRGIFDGMHQHLAGATGEPAFPRSYPLVPTPMAFGPLDVRLPPLSPGAATFLELAGSPSTHQTLELRTSTGGQLGEGSGARMGVVRIR